MQREANDGPRHRAVTTRIRYCALTTVVALPLTLNASTGLMASEAEAATTAEHASRQVRSQPGPGASELPVRLSVEEATLSGSPLSGSPAAASTVKVSSPKGARTWTASSLAESGLPSAAKRAYVSAATTMGTTDPACQLPWTLLAGIGRVESDHGRYDGAVLGVEGVSRPLIIGVALNGVGPVAAIRDSDNGRIDRDKVWDRAVGPMQFIPTTWAGAAADGDGDGLASPHDINDAALAAAAYLCSGSGSVLGTDAMGVAIFRYNQSEEYVALVLAMEVGYRTGVFIMPEVLVEKDPAADRARKRRSQVRQRDERGDRRRPGRERPTRGSTSASAGPGGTPDPKPSGGTSTGHPKPPPGGNGTPAPKPPPPKPPAPKPPPPPPPPPEPPAPPPHKTLSGVLVACAGGWCVGTTPLDLGPQGQLDARAAHDYDGLGGIQTNALELAGLAAAGSSGPPLELLVAYVGRSAVVYAINSEDYRFGDGSFAS